MTTQLLLRLYDWFARHRLLRFALPFAMVLAALASASQLHFKEDITDFLPNDHNYRRSMEIYRQTNAADRIFIVASPTDTTQLNTALLVRAMQLLEREGKARGWQLMAQADFESVMRIPDFAYQNAPLLLGDADFARIRRITSTDSMTAVLQRNREMLLFPTGGMVTQNIERDPLGLFTPLLSRLQASGNALRYELHDGYIFTPDDRHAVAMLTSPYGASETNGNALLVKQIDSVARSIEARVPGVHFAATGAPVIAVDNASQIKTDSIWAISIAATLIVGLLVWALRRARHLLLIVVSLGFGNHRYCRKLSPTFRHPSGPLCFATADARRDCLAPSGGQHHHCWCLFGPNTSRCHRVEPFGHLRSHDVGKHHLVCSGVLASLCGQKGHFGEGTNSKRAGRNA